MAGSYGAGPHSPVEGEVKDEPRICQASAMEKGSRIFGREAHILKDQAGGLRVGRKRTLREITPSLPCP